VAIISQVGARWTFRSQSKLVLNMIMAGISSLQLLFTWLLMLIAKAGGGISAGNFFFFSF